VLFRLESFSSVWCDIDKDSSRMPDEERILLLVRFEVLKAMNMKISVPWL
jgi:hypothetical protein